MKLKSGTRRYSQGARAQAAQATGQRIIDAFLALLMKEWFDEITLDRVAEDAGVTVQTVVRRFGGKEGLLGNAVKVLGNQITARRSSSNGLDESVKNLIADYEQTGDAVIRLLALEPRHPALKKVLDFGRNEHRQWALKAFAEHLNKLDKSARSKALDALIVNTDVYVWKLLRRDMARNEFATTTTIKRSIGAILSEFSKPH